jgi:hypothetical protein
MLSLAYGVVALIVGRVTLDRLASILKPTYGICSCDLGSPRGHSFEANQGANHAAQ